MSEVGGQDYRVGKTRIPVPTGCLTTSMAGNLLEGVAVEEIPS